METNRPENWERREIEGLMAIAGAMGAAIPINLIAQELRLSPTPVREALSRLAGEELVEKQGHAYTRPKLDGVTLAELKVHPVLKNRMHGNRWVAGQPDDIYNDFMDAMGMPERKRPARLKAAE